MATEIAQEILRQMGGTGRIMAMTGAKNFVALPNGVSFRIGGGAKNGINSVSIILNSRDLYDVSFCRIRKLNLKVVASAAGIYNDQLKPVFERETGMYLSL